MAPTAPLRTASVPVYPSGRSGYYVNPAEPGQWVQAQEAFSGRYSNPPSRPYSRASTPPYAADYSARAQQQQHQQQLQQLLRLQQQEQQQLLKQQERYKIPTPPMSLSSRPPSPTAAAAARYRAPTGDEYIRQISGSKSRPSPSTAKSAERLRFLDFHRQILDFLPFRGQAYQNVNECLKKGASLEILLREAKLGYERAPIKSDEEEFYLITMEDVERRIAAGQRGFGSTRR